jgi:hypothetical protein
MLVAELFQRPWRELWIAIAVAAFIPWLLPVRSQDRGVHTGNGASFAGATIQSSPDFSVAALVAHPLFDPSRRPKQVVKPTPSARVLAPRVASVRPDITGYVLLGTVVSPRIRTALILRPLRTSAELVHPNMMIGPWTVTSIESSHVVLRAGLLSVQLAFPDLGPLRVGARPPSVMPQPPPGPPFGPRR